MVRLFALFIFYVCLPFYTIQAAEIYSAKRINGEIFQFKEFTSAEDNLDVSFRLESNNTTSSFDLIYSYANQKKQILDSKLEQNEILIFPAKGKFINLKEPGLHTFTFEFENSSQKSVSIYIAPWKEKSIKKLDLKFDESSLTPVEVNYKVKKKDFGSLEKYSVDLTRSSGSKIYRELASSVPLIVNKDGIGTGSVLTESGIILTNWHVIKGASEVKVVFKPQKFQDVRSAEHFIADVVKFDVNADLALIKLRSPPPNLKVIQIGVLDDIEVAINVHAIGHPKGNFWTYTKGVISQLRPNFEWGSDDNQSHKADVIQTQTPINPGNSGGPLFNDAGLMIGVNSFIDPQADGLNFAVAVSTVRKFFDQKEQFKKSTPKPKAREKGVKFDFDEDGYEETTGFDDNHNGTLDRFTFDNDRDGAVDEIWWDEDENNIVELKIYFVQHDGNTIAVWHIDENQDKIVETKGFDFDMDGKLDKVEKI